MSDQSFDSKVNPGSLHKMLNVPQKEVIPIKKLEVAYYSYNLPRSKEAKYSKLSSSEIM